MTSPAETATVPKARKPQPRKKSERAVALPAGLVPLLDQRQLETYYGVSDWTVNQWVKAGMPVEPMAEIVSRRFDLAKVQAWHAERAELAETA